MRCVTKIALFFLSLSFAMTSESYNAKNTYTFNSGTGAIMTPNARFNKEGTIALNISYFEPINKLSLVASPFNWLESSVYYNDINVRRYFPGSDQSYKDKGFSFKIKLLEETSFIPSFALGFEDIAGTSIFKSEYFVASKKVNDFDISLGIGFGDYGSRSNIKNFFRDGDRTPWDFSTGGEIGTTDFFRGGSSLFGSIIYFEPKTKMRFKVEYDGNNYRDNYDLIPGFKRYISKSRYNYSLEYPINRNFSLNVGYIRGSETVFNFVSQINIGKKRKKDKFRIVATSNNPSDHEKILSDLRSNQIFVQRSNIDHDKNVIEVEYSQSSYYDREQVSRNIKKYISDDLGYYDYEIVLRPKNGSYYLSSFNYNKFSDKPKLEKISTDGEFQFNPKVIYPLYSFSLSPTLVSHIGSPSGFYFGGIDLSLDAAIEVKNFQLSSRYSTRIADNMENLNYDAAPTSLPRVRTYIQDYLKEGKNGFDEFTLNYFTQNSSESFLLMSLGHLEQMFSGAHLEYLYRPAKSLFSAGFEVTRVKQRGFDKGFDSFLNYQTNTGHLNIYVSDPPSRVQIHLSYGKYLAKDVGYTLDVSRKFRNGAAIGFFYSDTNITSEQFGEGSFDKGVYFRYPLFIFNNNRPTNSFSSFLWRPVTRDGAVKLNLTKRLFDLSNGTQYSDIFLKRSY